MKILPLLLLVALCLGSLGCEMHPAPKGSTNGEETPAASDEPTRPETVNPDPPSFFPTPKSG
jgi:hypothetical protein